MNERITTHPQDSQLYVQRAELYSEHEEWTKAFTDYDMAEKLNPQLETGLLRAKALLAAGHSRGSLMLLNNFLNRHPVQPQALVCRARVLLKLERQAEALSDYREALCHTEIPEPDLVLEFADTLATLGRAEEAVQVLNMGIGKLGCLPAFVLRAIELEIALKNFEAALARVDVMRQNAPRPEPWMARQASVLAQAGRLDESITAWKTLIDHLAKLPAAERGCHAMTVLKEESQQALVSLDHLSEVGQRRTTP